MYSEGDQSTNDYYTFKFEESKLPTIKVNMNSELLVSRFLHFCNYERLANLRKHLIENS